jgi:hypothetical protein
VRDAYLEPWTVFAPAARLREAFALAEQRDCPVTQDAMLALRKEQTA